MMEGFVDQIAQENLRLVKIKDNFVSTACPFHSDGQERHPSFWINRSNGKWGCFSCHKGGSSIKWLLKELGLKSYKIDQLLEDAEQETKKNAEVTKFRKETKARKSFKGEHVLPDALLGLFDYMPNELVEAGFTPETLQAHDVGYDKRNDRITFPIRDLYGNLIGISGRATGLFDEPKYLVYRGRTVQRTAEGVEETVNGELGEWYPEYTNEGIRDHLWGMEMIYEELYNSRDPQLIIVEGYKAKMWVKQCGYNNVVALMGSAMSPSQEKIIRSIGPETFVLLDNNYPGRSGAKKICQTLAIGSFPVYRCNYPTQHEDGSEMDEEAQPDDLSESELDRVLCSATRTGGRSHGKRIRR